MTAILDAIILTLLAVSLVALFWFIDRWKKMRQDVHVWIVSHKLGLAETLLQLRNSGYRIKSVTVTQFADHRNAASAVEAIIITEQ